MKMPFGLPSPPAAPAFAPPKSAYYLLFTGSLLAMAPHLARLPAWLGAVAVSLVLWRIASMLRGSPPPGVWVRAALSLAMIALIVLEFQTIFGRDAGTAMLVGFAALKLLETSRLRDAMFSNILISVVVIAQFLFDQSPASAAYGLACLIIIIVNFNLLVAPGPLMASNAMRLTTRIILHGLPLAIVAYILFPRIEGSLWGITVDTPKAVSGLSDRISHGSVTELSLNDAVAFRVDFDGPAPARDALYWRVLVLEQFDGRTWLQGRPVKDASEPRTEDRAGANRYRVTLEANNERWLPVLEHPVSISGPNRLNESGLGTAPRNTVDRTRYEAVSVTSPYLPADNPGPATRRLYPGISREITDYARSLASGSDDAEKTAARILRDFREGPFYYTLSPAPTGAEPVKDFLFNTREGYCEHYASAFATLMRAAGFASRVVVGYQGGELNPTGGYYIVRQSDAHAWTEVWVQGQGWRRVDPTAAVAPERIDLGVEALRLIERSGGVAGELSPEDIRRMLRLDWFDARLKQLSLFADSFTFQWNNWVMAYGPQRQRQLLVDLGVTAPDWTFMALGLTAAIAAFMLLTYIALSAAGRERDSPGKYFRRFKRKLERAGFESGTAEGPLEFGARAAAAFPREAEEIGIIADRYAAIVYAPVGRATLDDLRRRVDAFKPGVRAVDTGNRQSDAR